MTRYTAMQRRAPHAATAWAALRAPGNEAERRREATPAATTPSSGERVDKKDRRREQRRLRRVRQRERQKVCYGCRKPGHSLINCPEAKASAGQCYKCGSSEHATEACPSSVETFDFAICFICHQTGHLSRSCPDNPRGLYPDGGCCGLCGSVEHYKKDCPDLQTQSGNKMTLDMLQEGQSADAEPALEGDRGDRGAPSDGQGGAGDGWASAWSPPQRPSAASSTRRIGKGKAKGKGSQGPSSKVVRF